MQLKVGTRTSQLAMRQAEEVVAALAPYTACKILAMSTTADKKPDKPLYEIGGKNMFVKELEESLLQEEIDLAVHSLKDVPYSMPEELMLIAVLPRANPYDTLVTTVDYPSLSLKHLPLYSVLATSSFRRTVELKRYRFDLKIEPIRGNVITRLNKLVSNKYGGLVLAAAGLQRLFGSSLPLGIYCQTIPPQIMLPSPGQGAIVMQIRKQDTRTAKLCKLINHLPTWVCIQAERGFVETLKANCEIPLGALATLDSKGTIYANYMLASTDGNHYQRYSIQGLPEDSYYLGVQAAQELYNFATTY